MNGNADVVAQLDVALEDEQDVHEGGEEESDPDKTSRLRHASSTCPSLHPVGTDGEIRNYYYICVESDAKKKYIHTCDVFRHSFEFGIR